VNDIVTLDVQLQPENGFVPESLFDTSGRVSFVLGWGNYLPGLHSLVEGTSVGSQVANVSIDAGYGSSNPSLVFKLPKSHPVFRRRDQSSSSSSSFSHQQQQHQVGDAIRLNDKIQVHIKEIMEDEGMIVVDGNHPLAGSSYSCSFRVLDIQPMPSTQHESPSVPSSSLSQTQPQPQPHPTSRYQVATWAMGCFWGGELAFMRQDGVVGTKVGYTQGITPDPTYEQVSQGTTQHREAVMVVYDTTLVSYDDLVKLYMKRLSITSSPYFKIPLIPDEDGVDSHPQYRHGIYFHNEEQRRIAHAAVAGNNNQYQVELRMASAFYDAEPYHQQYLLKGGQSARKNAKETIRCFG